MKDRIQRNIERLRREEQAYIYELGVRRGGISALQELLDNEKKNNNHEKGKRVK